MPPHQSHELDRRTGRVACRHKLGVSTGNDDKSPIPVPNYDPISATTGIPRHSGQVPMTGAPANAQGVPPLLRHTGRLHPGAVSRAPRCKAIGNSMAVPCGLARTTPATGLAITGARKKPIVGRRHEAALPFCHHLLLTPVSTMPAATVPRLRRGGST